MGRKKKNKKEDEVEEVQKPRNLSGDVKRSIVAVTLFALAVLSLLGFFGAAGSFGGFLNKMIASAIGWIKFIFPIFLIFSGIVLLLRKETAFYVTKLIGLFVILLSFTGFIHWFFDFKKILIVADQGRGGGYVGYALVYVLEKYLGSAGSLVVILALLFLGIILTFDFSIIHFIDKIKKKKENKKEEEVDEEKKENENEDEKELLQPDKDEEKNPLTIAESLSGEIAAVSKEEAEQIAVEKNIGRIEFVEGRDHFVSPGIATQEDEEGMEEEFYEEINDNEELIEGLDSATSSKKKKTRPKKMKWIYPPENLLERSHGVPQGGDSEKNSEIIQKTLGDFGIKVEPGGVKTGPAVTQYSFRPAVGVKISKILSLQNDLSLALAAHPIRIEAPIPGQSLIGIEIPNKSSMTVRLRDMVEERDFKKSSSSLTLALGKDVSGNCIFGDLTKMPHLMIAGATGTGKSVGINTLITSLLYKNSPEDLRFIMVDPKRVELSLYNGIPHLLTDVVVENAKVVNVLKWAVGEMERRYRLLQDTGSRDLNSYREKLKEGETLKHTDPETGEVSEEELKKLPYIVIIIDELADLMGSHGKEVEGAIVRIAQMARAVGIHLIVSTQRPSVEVITGLIKANITTRIAFQVATQIDSRTILDMGGAEKLLGRGDMLFLSSSSPKPVRIQGVFVDEAEVKKVVKFMKDQKNEFQENENEDAPEEIVESSQKSILEYKPESADEAEDELLSAAKEEIVKGKKASASFLQRRLRIGYARAARLLDILEEKGIVGPADGAKPREIYGLSDNENISYQDSGEDQTKRDKWDV